MGEKKGLGLRQTKGYFQIRGTVTGTEKGDSFYKEGHFDNKVTGKPVKYRSVNFGVNYDKNSTDYVGLMGNEKDKVYLYKSEMVNGKKQSNTMSLDWSKRYDKVEDGYKLIGTTVGVKKIANKDGKMVNETKSLTEYDAVKEIATNLVDNNSVFVSGVINYSTYQDKHKTDFSLNKVLLCKSDIDFYDDKFKPENKFKQEIVFMGIKPNVEYKKKTGNDEFIVSAKIIGYNSIEDTELYIRDKNLANTFKKCLKPYTMILVGGNIVAEQETETVEQFSGWGVGVEMNKAKSQVERKLIINGADDSTIDAETYSEEIIEEALAKKKASVKAKKEYGSNDEWGKVNAMDNEDSYEGEDW